MSQPQNALSSNQEGRVELALQAYRDGQFRSLRSAAKAFDVPRRTLTQRFNETTNRVDSRNGRLKLTSTKEQTIVQYILDLDSRGFPPRLCEVADMADKLLGTRGK